MGSYNEGSCFGQVMGEYSPTSVPPSPTFSQALLLLLYSTLHPFRLVILFCPSCYHSSAFIHCHNLLRSLQPFGSPPLPSTLSLLHPHQLDWANLSSSSSSSMLPWVQTQTFWAAGKLADAQRRCGSPMRQLTNFLTQNCTLVFRHFWVMFDLRFVPRGGDFACACVHACESETMCQALPWWRLEAEGISCARSTRLHAVHDSMVELKARECPGS